MASDSYHEPYEALTVPTKDLHRAIVSLMEELEAIDWYQQRADVCADDELRAVLVHNKNEEIEHAMMNLEWIRRNSPEFDDNIRTYLNSTGPITEVEEAQPTAARNGSGPSSPAKAAPASSAARSTTAGSLGIGSLKEG